MKMMGFRDMQYRHSFGSYSWLRNDSSWSSVWGFWLSVKRFRLNRDVLSKVQGNVGEVRSDKKLCRLFSVNFPLEQATVSRNRHSFSVGT